MKRLFSSKGDDKSKDLWSKLQKDAKSKLPKLPDISKNLKLPAEINFKTISDTIQQLIKDITAPKPSGPVAPPRPMKYPYTLGAKIAQFPYKYYYKNNWIFRYYPLGFLSCFPVFWYISRMSNSKANKAKWKEIRRQEKEHALHKFD